MLRLLARSGLRYRGIALTIADGSPLHAIAFLPEVTNCLACTQMTRTWLTEGPSRTIYR